MRTEQEQNEKKLPSVEKPWMKYYDGEFKEEDIPDISIYQFARERNKGNEKNTALDIRSGKNDFKKGIQISYETLFKRIEKSAISSRFLGIETDEIVPVLLPNIPEARVMIYSNSILGATSYPMSPFIAPNQLDSIIKENGIKNLVIFAPFYEKYKGVLEDAGLSSIITVDGTESLPFILRKLAKKQTVKVTGSNIIPWSEYMSLSKPISEPLEPYYREGHIAAIIGTSGTTGVPKGVKITDKNLNAVALTYIKSKILEGTFCDALIPSISYGLSMMHYETAKGNKTYLIPELVSDNVDKLFMALKPDSFAGGPIHAINIARSKNYQEGKVPHVKEFVSGGATLPKDVEQELNGVSEGYSENGEYNPKIVVRPGYGLTEGSASCTYNKPGVYRFGSIGIPFPYENVGIFKPDTDEELPYNELGEICISGPCVMAGYLNNEEETEKILKYHADGKIWIHTKDIGYITPDGHLYHVERIKNIFMRSGFNVHPSKITEFINCLPDVKESFVVGVEHPDEQCVPVAFIVPENNGKSIEEVEENVKKECSASLEACSVPYDFVFVDQLPINLGGKIDKNKILEKANIDFKESPKVLNKRITFKQE